MKETLLICYIVDPLGECRETFTSLIDEHPNLTLNGCTEDPFEAAHYLESNNVDLLIASIKMDKMNGFELVDSLENKPAVIFTSFDTNDAFKAFEYDAVDYLKQPFKKDRFLYAVEKAILKQRFEKEPEKDLGDFIFVKSNLKKRKVYLNTLRYVQALGDYVKLITNNDTLVVLSTMKAFEKLLPKDQFQRIHKSYIVNVDKVQKYSSTAIELDNEVLPLSRNKKLNFIEVIKTKEKVNV
ncbi:MAG: LytTR family DNA-binding domain-containing protein [Nonlabens sp.]